MGFKFFIKTILPTILTIFSFIDNLSIWEDLKYYDLEIQIP